jgi:hypothetical protein
VTLPKREIPACRQQAGERKSKRSDAFTEADARTKRCECRGVHLNLYECKVICGIVRHDAPCHFWGEPKRHLHRAAIFHDVGIGDDVAFGRDKKSGAERAFVFRLSTFWYRRRGRCSCR